MWTVRRPRQGGRPTATSPARALARWLVRAALPAALVAASITAGSPASAAAGEPAPTAARPMLDCGTQAGLPNVTPEQAIDRGNSWVSVNVPYDQGSCYTNDLGTYRQDCSGFVSMAWGLTSSYVTWTLPDVSHEIDLSELQPGDILDIPHQHTEMFVRWTDEAHTRADLMGETYPGNGTVVDHDQPLTTGYWSDFTPYRYNNMQPAGTPAQQRIRSENRALRG